ncbi:patatin [Aequorivita sp. H23M31]|uniref:Patatin n=1 Tax=Aequorivita ciconiae TaxID=2494375 RepID=A0A410G1E5_9FLAO|nr:patatin-like phospholipase family protein [Aequorivita sp. H23M31]QAA81096.1 patatin [Aequorivita sp. H23M31]
MGRLFTILTLFFLAFSFVANAQDTSKKPSTKFKNKKPKVALVLSGGGAKGLAHIPTLQMLDSLGIVPDLIVGNSMGSIVGGLYAMGYSGDSIVDLIKQARWDKLMGGGVSLQNVSAEEKAEFDRYMVELDWVNGNLKLGNFLLNDQNLREFITLLTFPVYDVNDFDDLPIPFRAMATDIVRGEEVILDSGSLALAMRASMSIPGVFQAVSYDGTLLVDGGLLNNFPVDVAKKMGADIIIGSDVGLQPFTMEKLQNLSSLMLQTTMLNSNIKRPENRDMCDILIDHSEYLTYSTGDFKSALAIYEEGKSAVQDNKDTLIELSKFLNQYKQREVELPGTIDKFVIDSIVFTGISRPNLALVHARTEIEIDTPYNIADVIDGVNRAMGTTLFRQVAYNLVMNDSTVVLHLDGVERSPYQVKGALHYDGYHGVGVIANYTARNVIGDASRLLITADIAEQPKFRFQYQKNFGAQRDWWWRTEVYGQQLKQKVFLDGEYADNVRNRYYSFDNQFNRNLKSLRSYIGLGVKYHHTNIKPSINPDLYENLFRFNKYDNYDIELYTQYNYNNMEKVLFATKGTILTGYLGKSLYGNLQLEFSDEKIPDFDGPSKGYTKLGLDYEKRFRLTPQITTILGTSAHFTFEDHKSDNDLPLSDVVLNSMYYLGGNILIPRNDFFVFPGLKEEEIVLNQFVKFNLGMQLRAMSNIYITPHFDMASVGFGNFEGYIKNALLSPGKWTDLSEPSVVVSAGTTFSYNSILGPINFDASWVNNINKVRFFIGIGFHLNRSN